MRSSVSKTIRVLAVDDSVVMRGIFRRLFETRANGHDGLQAMELCGVAQDGLECMEAIPRLAPDVIVLDLEMPRMHGLDVLRRLKVEHPKLPVILCSAYTEYGARLTLEALAAGASDYITKPTDSADFASALDVLGGRLLPLIAALSEPGATAQQGSDDAHTRRTAERRMPRGAAGEIEMVVIGVSTGGPTALEQMLPKLPASFPVPVLIVQHMPKLFTGALAQRLDRLSSLRVREAKDGDRIEPGTIWLAPGDAHMAVMEANGGVAEARPGQARRPRALRIHRDSALNHGMPSVDHLFRSAARTVGRGHAGAGDDGNGFGWAGGRARGLPGGWYGDRAG